MNQYFFLYHEIQHIILKTEEIKKVLREQLQNLQGISCLFLYGSSAAGTAGFKSDIDRFIVGDIEKDAVLTAIGAAEEERGREINYTLMTDEEFRKRQRGGDPFVSKVMREPRVILAGCRD